MNNNPDKLGPTGEFPHGSLGPSDEGAVKIGVAHDSDGNVVINFGAPMSWIAMPPEQAMQFAKNIMKHAGAKTIEVTF